MKSPSPPHPELFEKSNPASYMKHTSKGLSKTLVHHISQEKKEPSWMLKKRLLGLELFHQLPFPSFGPDLSHLDFNRLTYYAVASKKENSKTWADVPTDIRKTFERLGIPKAEHALLAGVGAQYESTMVYHNLKKTWEEKGVIFENMDVALHKYPDMVQKHFMKCVPPQDHKFAALHTAVWSGGTFLYVPKGVKVEIPLQAYFRMNAPYMGQFEHTLIIIDEGAEAHYIEGCSAPRYGKTSLHAGCVEIYVKKNARFRYSSVENWSKDTYNLNTKRAIVEENATMEWVGGNFGSGVTMLYPCSILTGRQAKADHLGIAFAGPGQIQDTGAKVIHAAPYTSSHIVMKSLSSGGGKSVYRGTLMIQPQAHHSQSAVNCDALILDDHSRSDTYPKMDIRNNQVTIAHEASVGKIGEEELFYLTSRGIPQEEAMSMIVNGFIEPIVKTLPLEYAVELNRLIMMEMEGSVG